VSAINRAGQGSPSDPTAPLLVKALNAPPKIDRKVLGESQSVKASSLNGHFKKIFGLFLSVSADAVTLDLGYEEASLMQLFYHC
jgi:hypothetical protein